jgi:hypothetical protein
MEGGGNRGIALADGDYRFGGSCRYWMVELEKLLGRPTGERRVEGDGQQGGGELSEPDV